MLNPLKDFVAFDLETTGLERDTDEIVEFGAVRVTDGLVAAKMSCLVKTEKPMPILVATLTGITEELLAQDAIPLPEAMARFQEFAGALPLVAHNSEFDAAFISQALTRMGMPPLANTVLDSLLLARTAWPALPSHRLESLVQSLGIPPQAAHRALPDAEQAAQLWLLAQEKLAGYAPETLALLRRALKTGPAAWRELFGANGANSGDGAEDATVNSLTEGAEANSPDKMGIDGATSVSSMPTGDGLDGAALTPKSFGGRIEDVFASEGPLAQAFAACGRSYEHRSAQARLAALTERCLRESKFLAVESEPGTGRLLAQLIPAIRYAAHKRRPVLLALPASELGRGRTEALAGETSLLRQVFGAGLRVSLLKPPSAYLSPRKFAAVLEHADTRLREEERLALLPLITWRESAGDGDIGDNMGFNADRNRLLWSKLCADNYASEPGSPAHAARQKAQRAHVVILSQELALDDLALDFALLPAYEAIVFEEAHRLPELGQTRLGREISFFRLKYITQLIAYGKTESAGLLADLESLTPKVPDSLVPPGGEESAPPAGAARTQVEALKEKIFEPEKQLQKMFNKIAKQAQKRRKDGESKIRYADKLVMEFGTGPEAVVAALHDLETSLAALAADFPALAPDLRKVADLLRDFRSDLEHLAHPDRPGEIYWIEDFTNPHRALIRSAPLDVGPALSEKLYPQLESAVFSSSALAVGDQFSFYCTQVGLASHRDRLKTALVRLPENHGRAPLLIAKFSPVLNNAASAQTQGLLIARGLLRIARPAFGLFTHIGMLKQFRTQLQLELSQVGRLALAQHVDGSRENLLHLFRHRRDALLLGTEAFVSGLSGTDPIPEIVFITKLPFPVPTDPLTAAHVEKVQADNGNTLFDHLLPSSILRLKQELNRLPRRSEKPLAVWILDPRLATEKYARAYLRGLGLDSVVCGDEEDLFSKTEDILAGKFTEANPPREAEPSAAEAVISENAVASPAPAPADTGDAMA